jgi:hypothetical protein
MFQRLEECGYLLRLDPTTRPRMFHAATVSRAEIVELQRIKNIVRAGHVTAIESHRIVLHEGEIATTPAHIHVDCSASLERSFGRKKPSPVFVGDCITPQMIRAYQPAFSASLAAYVEAHYADEVEKNRLCTLVPTPNYDVDFIPMTLAMIINQYNWSQDEALRRWCRQNRLDGFGKLIAEMDRDDRQKTDIMRRIQAGVMPAVAKLQQFSAELADGAKK